MTILFISGIVLGATLGVLFMALLQISKKEKKDDNE